MKSKDQQAPVVQSRKERFCAKGKRYRKSVFSYWRSPLAHLLDDSDLGIASGGGRFGVRRKGCLPEVFFFAL